MDRSNVVLWSWCLTVVLACSLVRADETGQELLDKATETKISAETAGDLNDVITLCRDALKAGLDDAGKQFANELLASTLTQRSDLICTELFEHPVRPGRAKRLVQMALEDLQASLEINADQSLAQFLIGRLYAHLGEKEKALTALDAAVKLSADDQLIRAQALMIRANLREKEEDRLADFNEAVKLTPQDPDVFRFRGMYHLSEERPKEALDDFQAALAIEPDDADTHEACGLAQSVLQKYDEAVASFDKAIELDPKSAAAYTHRGRVRAIQGDADAALTDAEKALDLQPGSVPALQLHAALLGNAGKFDEALRDLTLLRRAMPEDQDLLLQIAAMHQASKRPDKAIEIYEQVLEADPKSVAGYRGRADAYLSLGKQSEALGDYEKALEHEPDNSGVLNNLAWVLATSPDDKLRNGTRAVELAKKACEVTEYKQAHILSTLAASYAESGDFASAVDWSKKAVELGPDPLKGQLQKELESYEAQKPWREAMPPDLAAAPDNDSADDAAPKTDDTAGSKRAR
ncbi:MAG: tetratricopeptide repeat protein [Pirellulales bacterium]